VAFRGAETCESQESRSHQLWNYPRVHGARLQCSAPGEPRAYSMYTP